MDKVKVNGEFFDWQPGLTLNDLLQKIEYAYTPLAVRVDGKLLESTSYDKAEIPAGSDVQIIRIISGG